MPIKVKIVQQGATLWFTQFPPPLNKHNDAWHHGEDAAREHIDAMLPGCIVEVEVHRAKLENSEAHRS